MNRNTNTVGRPEGGALTLSNNSRSLHEVSLLFFPGKDSAYEKSCSLCLTPSQLIALVDQLVKSLPEMWETWIQSLGQEDPLEKEKATCSSILAWRIPWTGAWWATVHGVTKSRRWLSDSLLHPNCIFSLVAQSLLILQPHGLQHTRLPCPPPAPRACSNSCSWSRW